MLESSNEKKTCDSFSSYSVNFLMWKDTFEYKNYSQKYMEGLVLK